MKVAVTRKEIESATARSFRRCVSNARTSSARDMPTGVVEIDKALGGFPRGAITEIHARAVVRPDQPVASALSAATSREETAR